MNFEAKYSAVYMTIVSIILGFIILSTIIGNVLVVAAIMLEKNLQSISNYLIISLAVADLLVAAVVMPFAAIQSLSSHWWLGTILCDIFRVSDVLLCTVSILHLICVALDRYWAVTRVDYIRQRSSRKIFLMIFLVWLISLIISIPSRFFYERFSKADFEQDKDCGMNNEIYYTIFSTVGAFHLPMLFMCFIYAKIYQAAIARIRKTKFNNKKKTEAVSNNLNATNYDKNQVEQNCDTTYHEKQDDAGQLESQPELPLDRESKSLASRKHRPLRDSLREERKRAFLQKWNTNTKKAAFLQKTISCDAKETDSHGSLIRNDSKSDETSEKESSKMGHILAQLKPTVFSVTVACTAAAQLSKERLEHQREKKAAITLAIITGCFMLCWIPFFIIETLKTVKPDIIEYIGVWSEVALWLGYINSLLNPVIYTIFSPDFRNAFRKIIFGRYRARENLRNFRK